MKRRSQTAEDDIARGPKSSRRSDSSPNPPANPPVVWVSPSSLRNFAYGDPLLDWLDLTSTRKPNGGINRNPRPRSGFTDFIMNQGVEFEARVVELLRDLVGDGLVSIEPTEDWTYATARTLAAMRSGAPIIYHGRMCDEELGTRGEPDLLVRADFLNTLFPGTIDEKTAEIRSRRLQLPTHYVVIEIKYHTLALRANGRNLLNNPSSIYYKLQTQLYSQIVGRLQGYEPKSAYVLGRGYTYRSQSITYSSSSCMDRLGVVDFDGVDADTATMLESGVDWIRRLRTEGSTWTLEPTPSVPELYPNMCNVNSGPHGAKKLEIAKRLCDITLLWYCGPKERARAHDAGILGFDDPRLTTETLGLNPKGVRTPIISRMISFHRAHALGKNMPLVSPNVLRGNRYAWRDPGRLEMFVDFETINNTFDDFSEFPSTSTTSMIFMIGLGWSDGEDFDYRSWHVRELSDDGLREMISEFIDFANGLCTEYGVRHPNMYHWSAAEPNWLSSAVDRVFGDRQPVLRPILCDAMKVLVDDSVCIRDVFGYSLKQVSRGLASIGRIPDLYSPLAGRCGDGMDAMSLAVDCYKSADPTSNPKFADIVAYNRVDCLSIWEILWYFRSEH